MTSSTRLNLQTLPKLTGTKLTGNNQTPKYDVAKLPVGIVHIGLGRFHRAHQALYTDLAIEAAGGAWGIAGVSLNSRTSVDQLNAQDGLYTVRLHGATESLTRVVGCIRQCAFLGDGIDKIVDLIAAPSTQIVTLTITEKGYHHHLTVGDAANPTQPKSAIGVLALALSKRFAAGGAPLTVISCDNLQSNGRLLQKLLTEYLTDTFPQAMKWLSQSVRFPNTMVDRIVPAMDETQIAAFNSKLPYKDLAPIETEAFGQWIIEDKFAASRPAWEQVGVMLVRDVSVFEKLKLSMLNATHSFMAYFGSLKGHTFVSEAIADDEILQAVQTLLHTELPNHIDVPPGFAVDAYAQSLVQRYRNPNLQHRLLQIAMDGSVKIPQRWLPSLQYNLQHGLPIEQLCKAVASWVVFSQRGARGAWPLQDPADPILTLEKLSQIFPPELLSQTEFQTKLKQQYQELQARFLK